MSRKRKRRQPNSPEFQVVDPKFVNDFLQRIEDYARQSTEFTAIVTFHSSGRNWSQQIDVIGKQGSAECEWGHQAFYRSIVAAKLINPETYSLSVVVRTFTEKVFSVVAKNGKQIEIPGKQIRMFFLPEYGSVHQLSAEDCFACLNTDARTGKPLPLDPTIEYIGD